MTTLREHLASSSFLDPWEKMECLLSHPDNKLCADCGSPDPKWVSFNIGVFICIKCSGVHRSLGVHISKVLSVKLDEWSEEQVDSLIDGGGNAAVNMRYEAFLPEHVKKPKPDSSIEERSEFIRRKYELQQFLDTTSQMARSASIGFSSPGKNEHSHSNACSLNDKKNYEKQRMLFRQGLGHAFRNSWRRKEAEKKSAKKNILNPPIGNSLQRGMVEFVGLIKVNIIRGTNLAIRDVMSSDPYVILSLGHQSLKTKVIKKTLNPIWNESLMLSIPDPIPPLKLQVFDKDTFSTDDRMGEAEIDIQPLVSAAIANENSNDAEPFQVEKWLASEDDKLAKDSVISLIEGKVKQEITLRLQNVERGELELELECVPLCH